MSSSIDGKTRRILEVKGLKKYFPIEKGFLKRVSGHVRAVDDVNLYINEGETLGLVGESGCGKTTLGRCIVRAIDPTEGEILYLDPEGNSHNLARMDKRALRRVRRYFHMIFQDPYSSLDPRMTVLDIIAEPIKFNNIARGEELTELVKKLMNVRSA